MLQSARAISLFRSALTVALLTAAAAALQPRAAAQSEATAVRNYGIDVFAAASRITPDYGPDADYGFTAGIDIARHLHGFTPALEIRYTRVTGDLVGEHTLSGGFKAEKAFNRVHVYADLLIGQGVITFDHPVVYSTGPYVSDNSVVYSFGGGLDYDIRQHFAVKIDAQGQSWKLGDNANRLTPFALSAGVVYRIPFNGIHLHR